MKLLALFILSIHFFTPSFAGGGHGDGPIYLMTAGGGGGNIAPSQPVESDDHGGGGHGDFKRQIRQDDFESQFLKSFKDGDCESLKSCLCPEYHAGNITDSAISNALSEACK